MIKTTATFLSPFLGFRPIRRIRRNHGLEHATIHMMTNRKTADHILGGRAVLDGFFIYGKAETEHVREAVEEAIKRMRKGEHELAVHPNCGTGIVTTGFLTSIFAFAATLGSEGWKERWSRLPMMMVFSIAAIMISQPASLSLQRYITTYGDPGDLEIVQISRNEVRSPFSRKRMVVHRIWTRAG